MAKKIKRTIISIFILHQRLYMQTTTPTSMIYIPYNIYTILYVDGRFRDTFYEVCKKLFCTSDLTEWCIDGATQMGNLRNNLKISAQRKTVEVIEKILISPLPLPPTHVSQTSNSYRKFLDTRGGGENSSTLCT